MINLSNDRTTKMELLKRKSRRKNLIKELNFMNLTEEPFLDIEDNDLFCKKVFSVLNTKKNKIQLQGDNYKVNIQKSIQLLNEIIDNTELTLKKGNLLFFRENEIEAVLINVHEVFSNLDKVLELTRFSVGYGDFILVAEDFNFGLCIERTEYFYEFSVWGLS
ncbi:YxiF family protein [Lysinibacillus sp. UGB7]|uniref:YxiF family protein n=1 Tax=Lysinibacillus TaxID=400634 RepID=UPI003B8140EC